MKPRHLFSGHCLALTLVLSPLGPLEAASRIWDGGGANANWDTAANWDGNTTVANADDLTFATALTSGTTINLNGSRTANSLTLDSTSAFTLANNTLTLTSGNITRSAASSGAQIISSTITLAASGVWNINGGGTLTVSGAIDDGNSTRSITKSGNGALILTGTYGYDGGTIINGGSLTISGTYNKSNSLTTLNAGTLTLDYVTNNSNKLQSTLNLGGGSLVIAGAASSYIETVTSSTIAAGASNISRSGGTTILRLNGITRNAGGTLNFSTGAIADSDALDTNGILGGWATVGGNDWAQNSTNGGNGSIAAYTTYTNSVAGTTAPGSTANVNFQASNTTAWNTQTINSLRFNTASASALTITAGNTLTLTTGGILVGSGIGSNNQSITGGTLAGASGKDLVVIQNGAGTLTIGSVIANNTSATALTKSGSGKLVLTGTNTYTGQTYLNQGTLSISANNNLGAAATGATLNLDGGTLEATATFGLFNGTAGTNNRAVTLAENGGTIAVTASNTLTVAGVVSGAGSLTKTNTGTLVLSGTNTYTAGTTISGGAISISSDSNLGGTSGGLTFSNGATLATTGSTAVSSARAVTLDSGGGTLNLGVPLYLSGAVTGGGGLVTGGNDLILNRTSGTNAIGAITVNSGRLFVQNTLANIGGSSVSVQSGATLDIDINAANSLTNTVTFASGAALANRQGTLAISTANVSLPTAGTMIFNSDDQATTAITVSGNYPTLTGNLTLQTGGNNATVGAVTLAGIVSGSANLTKTSTGVLNLSGANTHSGVTTVSGGTLALGNVNALQNSTLDTGTSGSQAVTFTVAGNNTYQLGGLQGSDNLEIGANTLRTGSNNANTAFSGQITGTGGVLTKAGTGTLTLTGASTYTGGTTVSAGKLLVNNTSGSGTGTGAVTVASGGTLAGTGTISGATTVQTGGIQSAGNGTGVQTFSNNLTYQSGSIFSWEIDRTQTQTRGTGYDAENVAGTLSGSGAIFRVVIGDSDFSNSFWDVNRTWANILTTNGTTVIASWASIFSGGFQFYNTGGAALATPTTQGSFSLSGNTLSWTAFTAVPEPTGALAGLLIAAGLMRRRRIPATR